MPSSGILHCVALVRTYVSEEFTASIIRVTKIFELGTLALTSNWSKLRKKTTVRRLLATANVVPSSPILVTRMMQAISSFETLALTRAAWRNIKEDGILHNHRRENLKTNRAHIFLYFRYSTNILCPVSVHLCHSSSQCYNLRPNACDCLSTVLPLWKWDEGLSFPCTVAALVPYWDCGHSKRCSL
jgi:hypothetical protein